MATTTRKKKATAPIKIVLDEANKSIIRAITPQINKVQQDLQMVNFQFQALMAQREAVMNSAINQAGHNGIDFDLDEELNLVQKVDEQK